MYDLELEKIEKRVEEKNYQSILIQMPEGMLDKPLQNIIDHLSKFVKIFTSGDPSYGVCDLAIDLAIKLECDMLVHFGHSEFGFQNKVKNARNSTIDVMLIPAYFIPDKAISFSSIKHKLAELGWKRVQLAATIQHLKSLEKLKLFLEKNGFDSVIHNTGQILGCHVQNLRGKTDSIDDSIDGLISIHAGFFHTHGVLLNSDKPLLQFDPYSEGILVYDSTDRKNLIQQRFTLLERAKKADQWGVLSSSKIGQFKQRLISQIENIMKNEGKAPIVVIAENINPQNMANFNWIDAWVVTACPRIALDDKIRYSKPVVTFREFLYLSKEITWEDLLEDGFF